MSADKDVEAHARMVRDARVRVQRLRARHEFYVEHGPDSAAKAVERQITLLLGWLATFGTMEN